jgi:hypothetical protein
MMEQNKFPKKPVETEAKKKQIVLGVCPTQRDSTLMPNPEDGPD